MKFIYKNNSCPCGYCVYYFPVEYKNDYFTVRKGICRKHDILRNPNDILCEDFILASGVHTKKWYPTKKGLED
ncbi:MAG: hypothetical protein IJD00_06685 [Clostridia bacterium]|nr:hypothetical protein [Clostridia bacterium]MBQ3058618.1 hypothetical protein [Clostridia bacterium]